MTEKLRLRQGILEWREIEGEVVAVDTRTATYLAVNRTGAALWPVLVDGTTREDLVNILVDTYGVDANSARTDVDAFIAMLVEQELLEP
jgi:hypothetical protein